MDDAELPDKVLFVLDVEPLTKILLMSGLGGSHDEGGRMVGETGTMGAFSVTPLDNFKQKAQLLTDLTSQQLNILRR